MRNYGRTLCSFYSIVEVQYYRLRPIFQASVRMLCVWGLVYSPYCKVALQKNAESTPNTRLSCETRLRNYKDVRLGREEVYLI